MRLTIQIESLESMENWLISPQMARESELIRSSLHKPCKHIKVVGTFYLDIVNPLRFQNVKTAVLTPEPNNEHDPNAVMVVAVGEKIGYVGKYEAEKLGSCLAYLHHNGESLNVPLLSRVTEIRDWETGSTRKEIGFYSYVPTFRGLLEHYEISRAFVDLDLLWDQLSREEIEVCRRCGFHPRDEFKEILLSKKSAAPNYPFLVELETDWLMTQYLVNYRRRIYWERRKHEREVKMFECYSLRERGYTFKAIAPYFGISPGTASKYFRELMVRSAETGMAPVKPPPFDEENMRKRFLKKWNNWKPQFLDIVEQDSILNLWEAG